ncbi:MAG TPA: 4-deoxy-4-formamido-L-arabinose-phosphoundecaprenol deformylase [Desulfobacteraceae bacterium]|nr:4-deoxy-4-formamido-L-arabinose-phosphoundecaprenol deformylase [Desulfobacteraceae bacterium]
MKLGLRIDVDTYRGTKIGVPRLLETLRDFNVKASIFFSVGPDNMGRNIWRLLKPKFMIKMFRSKAPTLYGWDIVFRGTIWQGPIIGERLPWAIKMASGEGHEVGLHAWDHYKWQTGLEKMSAGEIFSSFQKGLMLIEDVKGSPVCCSAVPAWKCTSAVLIEKEKLPFIYNSDCRGRAVFYPVVGGKVVGQPQVPTTMPTYDEVIGRNGITNQNYNDYLLSLIRPDQLNVLTIHAEVEGISCNSMFAHFLKAFTGRGGEVVPLGSLVESGVPVQKAKIVKQVIPGREGWVCCQSSSV